MPVNNKVVFCNAFPISKQSYNDAIGAQNKDFVNHFRDYYKEKSEREQWELYNKEIIEPYILLKSGFEGYGFTFADECTFKDYTDFVKQQNCGYLFNKKTEIKTVPFAPKAKNHQLALQYFVKEADANKAAYQKLLGFIS